MWFIPLTSVSRISILTINKIEQNVKGLLFNSLSELQTKPLPRIRHICDFSRGVLNARSTRSHPTLAPRPQICLIRGNGFCAVAGEGELNRRRGFGDRSWCLLLTREWLGIEGWFDLTILYWSKKQASIFLFNLYNFNLNAKHLFTIISEQAENFYSLPQIPTTTI